MNFQCPDCDESAVFQLVAYDEEDEFAEQIYYLDNEKYGTNYFQSWYNIRQKSINIGNLMLLMEEIKC